MSQKIISRYCKAVGRQLICLPETRQALLKGLRSELEQLPPEYAESLNMLETRYEKIPQTAVELQEAISAGERTIALERHRRRCLLIGVVAGTLILLLAVYIVLLLVNWPTFFITDLPVYN